MLSRVSRLAALASRSFATKAAPAAATQKVTLFAGDGIGPEIATAVVDIFAVR